VNLSPIEGPAAWEGPEIDWQKEGLHVLSPEQIGEIDGALGHLRSFGDTDFAEIGPEHFPLPTLGGFLAGLAERLRTGPAGCRASAGRSTIWRGFMSGSAAISGISRRNPTRASCSAM
jgi:hypothetical protein